MTTQNCRRAADVDVAAFLADPARSNWADFRAHARGCPTCAAELSEWLQVKTGLRLLSGVSAALHPTEEQLARFQRTPDRLSLQEQAAVAQHVGRCPSCRDELSSARSFDYTLLDAERSDARVATSASATAPTHALTSWAFWASAFLRRLLLRPAFAYALALVALVVAGRSYVTPQSRSEPLRSLTAPGPELPLPMARAPARLAPTLATLAAPEQAAAALALLKAYRGAYEARDLQSLQRLWRLSPEVEHDLQRLFENAREISVLLDVREIRADQGGDRLAVEFLQGVMRTTDDDRLYASTSRYLAHLQRSSASNAWMINDLESLDE